MTWMQTHFPKAFDLVEPRAEDVDFSDVAWHLARVRRFNAATEDEYSVADHSLRVKDLVADWVVRGEAEKLAPPYAVIHDGHEFALGDDITPKRDALLEIARREYGPHGAGIVRECLQRQRWAIDRAIHTAAGLPWPPPPAIHAVVKRADLIVMMTERRDLLKPAPAPWKIDAQHIMPLEDRIVPLTPFWAEREFLDACRRLLPALLQGGR